MAKVKKKLKMATTSNVNEHGEKLSHLYIAGEHVKYFYTLWETVLLLLKTLNMPLYNCTPRNSSQRSKDKNLSRNVHRNFIHNNHKLESIQLSFNG